MNEVAQNGIECSFAAAVLSARIVDVRWSIKCDFDMFDLLFGQIHRLIGRQQAAVGRNKESITPLLPLEHGAEFRVHTDERVPRQQRLAAVEVHTEASFVRDLFIDEIYEIIKNVSVELPVDKVFKTIGAPEVAVFVQHQGKFQPVIAFAEQAIPLQKYIQLIYITIEDEVMLAEKGLFVR